MVTSAAGSVRVLLHSGGGIVKRLLLAVMAFSFVGCGSSGPDPRMLIPVDAEAWLAVRPAREVAERIGPIVDQYPEYGGALDFARSVIGIDYARPDRESGLDPARGTVFAWFRGGLLVILPVVDQKLAVRRAALRMARFGFVQSAEQGGLIHFESSEHGHGCIAAKAGIAAVYFGPADSCPLLAGIADQADDSRESQVRLAFDRVTSEMEMEGADLIFFVANSLYSKRLLRMAGFPEKAPVTYLASGVMGDLRGAVTIDRELVARIAAGAVGTPFRPVPAGGRGVEPGDAARIDVTIGPSLRPLIDALVPMCGARCSRAGIDMMVGSWDGRLEVKVPASDGSASRGSGSGVLRALAAMTGKVTVTGVAGTRRPGRTILDFARRRLGQQLPEEDAGAADKPVAFTFDGHDVAVGAGRDRLAVAIGPSALESVSRITVAGVPGDLPEWPTDGRILSARVNPEALLDLSGFGFIQYLERLVNPVKGVAAEVFFDNGRILVDGRISIR